MEKILYLGIILDSEKMQIQLPEEKVHRLYAQLQFFRGKTRATHCQIQQLCGQLDHCAK